MTVAPSKKSESKKPALYTFAVGVVSALASIVIKGKGHSIWIVLVVVAAILLVFAGMLWYQIRLPRPKRKLRLDPNKLVRSLSDQQRDFLALALKCAVDDV